MTTEDTTPVEFTVIGIERVNAGRLTALACVEIVIGGVALTLQGVRVMRTDDGLAIGAPTFKDPKTGMSTPCILLPPALRDAIAADLLASLEVPVPTLGGVVAVAMQGHAAAGAQRVPRPRGMGA